MIGRQEISKLKSQAYAHASIAKMCYSKNNGDTV